jgi:cytidylate kinase
MTVITISRQFGSGGDEIVERICRILGYQPFDKKLIEKAALEAGLSDQEVVDYSEENFKVAHFLDRLFGRNQPVAKVRVWKEDVQGVRQMEELPLSEANALALVQRAIEAACRIGNVVVVGRGGQILLKDCPDILHVRIIAPMEERIQRVKQEYKLERRPAQDLIEAHDSASADYVKRLYGYDWADPLLYHLVLNTGKLEPEAAARLVVEATHRFQPVEIG